MKKVMRYVKLYALVMVMITAVLMTGCYADGRGTYFPDSAEMQENLSGKGYDVSVEKTDNGEHLIGDSKDTFIEFYWLDSADDAKTLSDELASRHSDYKELRSITNSQEYGNIVFCSNGSAMDDAGIQIIEVKVDD